MGAFAHRFSRCSFCHTSRGHWPKMSSSANAPFGVISSSGTQPFVGQEQLQTNHCSNEVFLLQLTGLGDHWKPPGPFCILPGTRDFCWIPHSHLRLDSSGNFLVVLPNKKRQRANLQPQHRTPDLVCVLSSSFCSVYLVTNRQQLKRGKGNLCGVALCSLCHHPRLSGWSRLILSRWLRFSSPTISYTLPKPMAHTTLGVKNNFRIIPRLTQSCKTILLNT